MPINVDLVNNIITSGVTLIVGAVGAIVAYKGTLKGAQMQIESEQSHARMQIEHEQKQFEETQKQQAEFTRKAIENFISIEIKNNFKELNNTHLSARLTENEYPFQYFIGHIYNYHEYNNLKYELIKYESEEVIEIINIYDMFYLIERKKDILNLTQSEYDEFKKAYHICLSKYL